MQGSETLPKGQSEGFLENNPRFFFSLALLSVRQQLACACRLRDSEPGGDPPFLALGSSFLYRTRSPLSPTVTLQPIYYGLGLAMNCQALKLQGLTGAEVET